MDFHSFPLRIMEVPDKPQEAILKLGFSDGIYGRSKGGITFSGWKCEHLPYLVEIDNWGVSRQPGKARAGSIWIWGYDEITWFAHQSQEYRANWLRYAWDWVRQHGPQRLSPDARQPHAGLSAGPQAMVLRQQAQPGGPRRPGRRGGDSRHLGRRFAAALRTPGRRRLPNPPRVPGILIAETTRRDDWPRAGHRNMTISPPRRSKVC